MALLRVSREAAGGCRQGLRSSGGSTRAGRPASEKVHVPLCGGLPLGCSGILTGSCFPRASDPRGQEATEPFATLPWKSHSFTSTVSYRSHRSALCGVEGREHQEVRSTGVGDRSWRPPAKCHNLSASLSVKWDHLPPLGAVRCSKQEAWRKAVGTGPHVY